MNPLDWLRQWGPGQPPDVLMSLAAVLVVASLVGEAIARTTRLPRMIGYTLAGWLAAVAGLGVELPFGANERLLVDLALALLLFEIGSQVRLRWLRNNPGLLATSLLESLVAAGAVYFALLWLDMPTLAAAACAVLTIPASAAVAGRVALELRAGGQVTQRMTLLTALNTLYGALAEHVDAAGAAAGGHAAAQYQRAALGLAAALRHRRRRVGADVVRHRRRVLVAGSAGGRWRGGAGAAGGAGCRQDRERAGLEPLVAPQRPAGAGTGVDALAAVRHLAGDAQ